MACCRRSRRLRSGSPFILEHLELAYALKGPIAVRQLRKHVKSYVNGFPGASRLRAEIMTYEDLPPLRDRLLREFPALAKRHDPEAILSTHSIRTEGRAEYAA
ncbi:MAG: hypothetical protein KatS3mg115_0943 [Candidatus Poribacteria bacterium]|nr:MAG: hypothetical protein KatS3mg115_0943 [Candidatus Poribacteria bacterium]